MTDAPTIWRAALEAAANVAAIERNAAAQLRDAARRRSDIPAALVHAEAAVVAGTIYNAIRAIPMPARLGGVAQKGADGRNFPDDWVSGPFRGRIMAMTGPDPNLRIREGGHYIANNGHLYGPMVRVKDTIWPWKCGGHSWTANGWMAPTMPGYHDLWLEVVPHEECRKHDPETWGDTP